MGDSLSYLDNLLVSFKLRLADFIYFYCSWPASISFATCGARSVINGKCNKVVFVLSCLGK